MKTSVFRGLLSRLLPILMLALCAGHALADPAVTVSTAALAADAKTLIINGTGFTNPSFTSVTFNHGAAGTVTNATATQLTVSFTTRPFPGNLTAVVTAFGQTSGTPVQVATVQPPIARFYTANQSALASDGSFRVTVNLSAAPNTQFASDINSPEGIVYDPAGNLYVAAWGENVVYKVTPDGTRSTFASGFNGPWAMALDNTGNLYVSNLGDNTVSKVTPAGVVSTFASGFNQPEGLAFDSAGNLYVANSRHVYNFDGTVSKVTPAGVVSTFASGFISPVGLAFDSTGNLYVASSTLNGPISKVTPGGMVSTFASGFAAPTGLVFDNTGNLYVANSAYYVGGIPSISKVTPAGVVSTVASAGLGSPAGIALDPSGNLCVSDPTYGGVEKLFAAVTVPFTVGGSAVAGVDYDNVTTSPLVFDFGHASATITGTLLSDPAATTSPRTLSFTLGTPTGATLGSTTTDIITILQPPVMQFNAASETVNAGAGTFGISASLAGQPTFGGGAAFTGTPFGTGLSYVDGMAFDAADNLYIANGADGTIRKITPGGVTSLFASGFSYPFCFTMDSAGNGYVVSSDALLKIAPNGTVAGTITTGLDRASGVVCDNAGNVYVATIVGGQWCILKYPPSGPSSTFASGFSYFLVGMAFGPDGYLYCGDQSGHIYKVASDGKFSLFASVTNFASSLAFDETGRLYVIDSANNTVSIFTPDGAVSQVLSGLDNPYILALDTAGNLYVGGPTLTKYLPTISVPFTLGGTAAANADYTALSASPLIFVNGQTTAKISGTLLTNPGPDKTLAFTLGAPTGAGLGSTTTNTLTITEPASAASVQFGLAGETINQTTGTFSINVTLSGTPTPTFAGGASPTVTTFVTGFNDPAYVAFDQAGNAYVANSGNGTVSKVTPGGSASTFASGFGATSGLAFDSTGNLYVASGSANTISKVTPTGSISTFASGLNVPTGLAFDNAGNLYVANYGGNSVSKITPGGVVSTVSSSFNGPQGVAFDSAGNLYVANANGNAVSVLTPDGSLGTFAAGFNSPFGLSFDSAGNLYVTNAAGNAVSRVTPGGAVGTLVSGLTAPHGLAFDSAGNLFVAITGALDKLTPSVTVSYSLGGSAVSGIDYNGVTAGTIIFAPGQTSATITGTLLADPGANQTLTFTLGSPFGAASGGTTTNTLTVVEPPPSVTASTAVLPITADTLVIHGIFNPTVANNSVVFNHGAAGTVTAASTSALTVAFTTKPAYIGVLTASVTSAGQTTAATQVATVIPAVTPTVSIIGLTSTTIAISGFGFDTTAANNTVVFNRGASGTVTAATPTQLTVTFNTQPTSTGTLTAVVTTDGLSSGSPVTIAAIMPTVQFSALSETVNATAGTFNVTATLIGNPSFAAGATATSSNFVTGLNSAVARVVSDAAGNLYALAGGALQKVTPSGTVTTLAEAPNFDNPTSLAIDRDGNLYVSNSDFYIGVSNVLKVTPAGAISTFIPNGAGLSQPMALACDSAGNLYVGQDGGSIVKVTATGVMNPFATIPAPLLCMAIDSTDNLYVTANDNTVRKVTPAGAISTFATNLTAAFSLTFDSANNLFVSYRAGYNQWQISQIAPDGVVTGNLYPDYNVNPAGLTFDPTGNLYFGNYTTLVRLAPTVSAPVTLGGTAQSGIDYAAVTNPLTIVNGQATGTITGTLLLDPPTSQTLTFTLGTPTGAALGNPTTNTMTIVEPGSAATIQFATASETVNQTTGTFSIPVTLVGSTSPSFATGAAATSSAFATTISGTGSVMHLALDASGNLYASNYNSGSVSKISPSGTVDRFYLTSGGYFRKQGLAFDSAGNLYVATHDDTGTGSVIKVTPSQVITTFATGLTYPHGLAFDTAGNLYVANGDNTVKKVTSAGVVSTFASGFSGPNGIAFDPSGNLYVANSNNNTVSKVTSAGAVSTFATGLSVPYGVTTDSAGNLYVNNYSSGNVNKVTPAGVMSTLSGVYQASGIAFDSVGNLYVGSYGNNSIVKLAPSVSVHYSTSGTAQYSKDYTGPIPAGGQIVFEPGQTTATLSGTLYPNPGGPLTLTITLSTPSGVALGTVKSNTMTIVEPAPSVTQNTAGLPINAPQITISGVFNRTAANNTVTFNNGAVGTVVVPGGGGIGIGGSGPLTSLTVNLTTPPNKVGPLLATVSAGGQSSTPAQVAMVVPVVTSTTSDIGLNATTLTINGFGFDPIAANNTVTFNNGVTGIVTAATATQLTIALTQAPTATGALKATVATNGATSVVAAPLGVVEPLAQFAVGSETANTSANTFSVAVTLTGSPTMDSSVPPNVSIFAAGIAEAQGLAFDTAGNLYVVSSSGDGVNKVTPDGTISTFASNFPKGQFYTGAFPYGLAFDSAGNLYVALAGTGAVAKVTPAGVITTFVSGLSFPEGLAFDAAGNLFIADYGNSTVVKVTPSGTKSTFSSAQPSPEALAFDSAGNLYVGSRETYGYGAIAKIAPDGTPSTFLAGSNAVNEAGLAFDSAGNLYASLNDGTIKRITPEGVSSTLLSGLWSPHGLAFDAAGNLYIAEYGNGNIDKVSANAIVPFAVSGTAVDGTDYTGLTVGPLVFVNGQPTVYITGTVLHHTGPSKTLTFTLGTSSGAVLGTTTTNMLTIDNSPVVTSSAANLTNDSATVTINGFGFDPTAANNIVTFNNGAIGNVIAATSTQLTVQLSHLPNGLGSLTATVSLNGQSSGTPVQIANVVPFAKVTNMTMSGGTMTLNFQAAPNTTYQLQYTPSLSPAAWVNVGPVTTNGAGFGQHSSTPQSSGQGFYRLAH